MAKDRVIQAIESDRDRLTELAEELWATPELGLHEEESSKLLVDELRAAGFTVTTGIGGMPTAFVASYGEGDPTIGILGEYDALPGLSQKVAPERDPLHTGEPGHGCGHNLFAVGSLGAAMGIKQAIDAGKLQGTVRYYGCPAEEILVGKVFMARAGVFDDLDAALTWHPNDITRVLRKSSLALDSIRFTFHGTAAHAASTPEAGRSALDALQLMNMGTESMREHIPDEIRVHYATTSGGDAPNVVPAEATVWYYVRAPRRRSLGRISDWVTDIAEGAATMTQTDVQRRFVTGCYQYRPNDAISDVVESNLAQIESFEYSERDRELAAELQETLTPEDIESTIHELPDGHASAARQTALYTDPVLDADLSGLGGSSDVGDVSWIVPTAWLSTSTYPVGTPAHSWQAVVSNGSFGTNGMIYTAKILAGVTYDLLNDPSTLESAWEEFDRGRDDSGYECPLPEGAEPPFDLHG